MRTVVVGIGNPILGDDGVGIHVLNQLRQSITQSSQDIAFEIAYTGGMNLLDLIIGYDKAVLIDAVNVPNAKEGSVTRISLQHLQSMHSCNPHDVSLKQAIQLAQSLGETQIPQEIIVIGVVLNVQPVEFSEQLSSHIAQAVPKAIDLTMKELFTAEYHNQCKNTNTNT